MRIDLVQIVGAVLSLAVSLALWFSSSSPADTIMAGLLVAVGTVVLDFSKRLTDFQEEMMKASAVLEYLHQDRHFADLISSIAQDYKRARSGRHPLFQAAAENHLIECRDDLHSLAEGVLRAPVGHPYKMSIDAIESAAERIRAVDIGEVDHWRTAKGQAYLEANRKAIAKGVPLERVFIFDRKTINENMDIFRDQKAIGVKVYLLDEATVSPSLTQDCLIVDDRIVTLVRLAPNGKVTERVTSIKEAEIKEMTDKFEQLVDQAIGLDDWSTE